MMRERPARDDKGVSARKARRSSPIQSLGLPDSACHVATLLNLERVSRRIKPFAATYVSSFIATGY